MILWLDTHISPKLVPWIHDTFGMDVLHVRDLGPGRLRSSIFFRHEKPTQLRKRNLPISNEETKNALE